MSSAVLTSKEVLTSFIHYPLPLPTVLSRHFFPLFSRTFRLGCGCSFLCRLLIVDMSPWVTCNKVEGSLGVYKDRVKRFLLWPGVFRLYWDRVLGYRGSPWSKFETRGTYVPVNELENGLLEPSRERPLSIWVCVSRRLRSPKTPQIPLWWPPSGHKLFDSDVSVHEARTNGTSTRVGRVDWTGLRTNTKKDHSVESGGLGPDMRLRSLGPVSVWPSRFSRILGKRLRDGWGCTY